MRTFSKSSLSMMSVPMTVAILLFVAVGCLAPLDFSHKRYREKYRLSQEDLKKIELYVSTEVMVRVEAGSPLVDDPVKSVIRLETGVAGHVLEAGADWLRVSFSDEGKGAYFKFLFPCQFPCQFWATPISRQTRLYR